MAIAATGFAISGPGLAGDLAKLHGTAPDIVSECVGKRGLLDAALADVRRCGRLRVEPKRLYWPILAAVREAAAKTGIPPLNGFNANHDGAAS